MARMPTWGRGFAVVASLTLAMLTSPVAAQPDEIEMEPDETPKPDPNKPPAKPPDKPADKPPADKPPPTAGDIEIDPAQPAAPVKDPKLAKKVATTAQQAAVKGDLLTRQKKPDEAKLSYEAAVTSYLKAIELGDDLNLYYDLGLVEDKLGKTAIAATHWRTVIKATAGVKPDVLKKATTKFEEVSLKVATVMLVINVVGATISLENVEIAKSPLALPLILMPGTYTFQLAADGYQLKDVELKIEAGSETERGIDLEPIKVIIDTKPPSEDTPPPPPPKPPSKLPLLIGASATGAFLLVSTITGLVAVSKHGTFVAGDTASFDRELARYDGKNFARVSDVALVATIGAAGFTAYWYFFKYKKAQRKLEPEKTPMPRRGSDDPQKTKVLVVPWVQSDAGGLTMGGRF